MWRHMMCTVEDWAGLYSVVDHTLHHAVTICSSWQQYADEPFRTLDGIRSRLKCDTATSKRRPVSCGYRTFPL
jgi:hypothetical protein